MRSLKFWKLTALGNDFVLVDHREERKEKQLSSQQAKAMADRRWGIGCDQLIELLPDGSGLDAHVKFWNADGSQAEMCGNGLRAVGVFLNKPVAKVRTVKGEQTLRVESPNWVAVEMGELDVKPPRTMRVGDQEIPAVVVHVGNPHLVLFAQNWTQADVERWGPELEVHPDFPDRTNVEWVEVQGPRQLRVGIWERGAGATLACGSGACASAAAAIALQGGKSPVTVELPGGRATVEWLGPGSGAILRGPAHEVFVGTYSLVE